MRPLLYGCRLTRHKHATVETRAVRLSQVGGPDSKYNICYKMTSARLFNAQLGLLKGTGSTSASMALEAREMK